MFNAITTWLSNSDNAFLAILGLLGLTFFYLLMMMIVSAGDENDS